MRKYFLLLAIFISSFASAAPGVSAKKTGPNTYSLCISDGSQSVCPFNVIMGNSTPVGTYVESIVASATFPATTTVGDWTSITLGAGDWDVSTSVFISTQSATSGQVGIGTSGSGTSWTNNVDGSSASQWTAPGTSQALAPNVTAYRVNVTSPSMIVYGKFTAGFAGTAPTLRGRLSARKIK